MLDRLRIPGTLLLLAGIALSGDALAQWKWRDADGQIHYSDKPPPTSVPVAQILTMSGARKPAASVPAAADPEAAASAPREGAVAKASAAGEPSATPVAGKTGAAAGSAVSVSAGAVPDAAGADPAAKATASPGGPRTPAERLNELRKQQAAREDAERKARELEQLEASVARWCEDLRGRERLLETGRRVARVDANGEQSFLSDEERETQLQAVRRDLRAKCSGRAT